MNHQAGSGNGEDSSSGPDTSGPGLDPEELKRRGEELKDDLESGTALVKEAIRDVIAEVERLPDEPEDPPED